MTEPIQPALTPEEWKEREVESQYGNARTSFYVDHKGRIFASDESPGGEDRIIVLNGPDDRIRHAIAALCLYGQPYGFTHEHLALLRYLNEGHDLEPDEESGFIDRALTRKQADCLALLVEIVAALLPPTP